MGKPNKNQNGFSAVEMVMVLIIIALIGVVGYMVYKNRNKTNTPSTGSTASTKTSPTPPVDPTAGWAMYTSQTGGFTFKYPTSGWTIAGARNPGYTQVTGSQLDGTEYEVSLKESAGQGLSTNGNEFNIYVNLGSNDPTSGLDNYVNSQSNPSFYTDMYKDGSVTTLNNGLQAWLTSESADSTGQCDPQNGTPTALQLVSDSTFYKQLPDGQLMEYSGTFCYGFHAHTTLSYQQQASSAEITVAKEVLGSFKFQ